MKNIIILLAVVLFAIQGCKKVENQYPSETKVISSPTITLNGDPVVILNVGDPYSDLGATYYDSLYGDNGTITTDTEVSTSEEGFFILRYTAKNKFGFEGSGIRLIAVTSVTDNLDVSGDYVRTANGYPVAVTKIGRGVFLTDNAGGNGFTDPVYFMFTGDSTMVMPTQFLINSVVDAAFLNADYDFDAAPNNYSYNIDAPGYGTQKRTFEKQ